MEAVTGSYVSRINIDWAEVGSGVLRLSIVGPNPDKELDFMNGLIRTYQNYDLEKKNQTAERTILFIRDQLKDISDSLKIYETQIMDYYTRYLHRSILLFLESATMLE